MSDLTINFRPTPKQDQAWRFLTDKTTTELLFGGGAGGGKSLLLCAWEITCALQYPGGRGLLGRSVLKSLKESTLLTFFDVAASWGLRSDSHFRYNQQDNTITFFNGSVIYLKDLFAYPSDPNFDSLGSTEYTWAGIDEANQVSHRAKEVVKSRLRYRLDEFGLIPKLALTCNPAKNWVYQEFFKPAREGKLEPGKAFVQALVADNPHISTHYIETLKSLKDPSMKERLLKGNWEYDDDPLALFEPVALHDLFTNTLLPSTDRFISCDAARKGRDKCVIMVWEGLAVIHITAYDISLLPRIEGEIERLRQVYSIPRSKVIIDEDGVGGGVVDHLPGVKGFTANATPIQDTRERREATIQGQTAYKLNYANLKAQCYYELADKVNSASLALTCASPEEQDMIVEDLEQVKGRDADKDGKIKIVTKEEMKEALGRSPDYADAMMMRMVFELQPDGPSFDFGYAQDD